MLALGSLRWPHNEQLKLSKEESTEWVMSQSLGVRLTPYFDSYFARLRFVCSYRVLRCKIPPPILEYFRKRC